MLTTMLPFSGAMGRRIALLSLLLGSAALVLAARAQEVRDGVFFKPSSSAPPIWWCCGMGNDRGGHLIGVHGAKPDPNDATARTIVVWVESLTGVELPS